MISAFLCHGLIKDSDFEIKVAQVGQVLHVCSIYPCSVKKEIRNWKKGKEKEVGTLGVRVAEERWSVWSPEGNYTETQRGRR